MKNPTSLQSLRQKCRQLLQRLLKSSALRQRLLLMAVRWLSRKGASPQMVRTLTRAMQLIQLILRLLPVSPGQDQPPVNPMDPTPPVQESQELTEAEKTLLQENPTTLNPTERESPEVMPTPTTRKSRNPIRWIIRMLKGDRDSQSGS